MEISATFRSEPEELVRGYRATHRLGYLVILAMGATTIALGVVAGSPFLALFSAFVLLLHELSVRSHAKQHASSGTFTVTMNDEEYGITSSTAGTVRPWTGFKSVKRVGHMWVLRVKPGGAMTLPASALDPAQTAAFEDLMRAKGLLPQTDLPSA